MLILRLLSFVVGEGIHGDPFLQYSVTAVPEPSTFVIVGSGFLAWACIFVWRQRHRLKFPKGIPRYRQYPFLVSRLSA
jgi:hypothetical protein